MAKDPRGAELQATSVLKQKASEAPGSARVALASGSRELKVSTPGPSRTKKALFPDAPIPAEELHKLQTVASLSQNQTKMVAQVMRQCKGRAVIEPNALAAFG